jgi:HAD superfamily hydrolase (TIGR01549 family)
MNRAGAIFDVDGTLVDSNYLHTRAWARAFEEAGERVPTYRIHRAIGMGSQQLIKELIGRDRPELSDLHSRYYRELWGELRAFDGAADLLREVAGRGGKVVLATSAKPDELETLLNVLDAGDAVHHVVSSKDVEAAKPEPDLFAAGLEAGQLDRRRAVVVGDSLWDVEAAARSELRSVALLTGGTGGCELEAAGAAEVFESPAELLRVLDSSLLGTVLRGAAA